MSLNFKPIDDVQFTAIGQFSGAEGEKTVLAMFGALASANRNLVLMVDVANKKFVVINSSRLRPTELKDILSRRQLTPLNIRILSEKDEAGNKVLEFEKKLNAEQKNYDFILNDSIDTDEFYPL